jgi:hypothetical protein
MAYVRGIDKDWGNEARQGIENTEVCGVQVMTYKDRPCDIPETLRRAVAEFPQKECIIDCEKRITYSDLN